MSTGYDPPAQISLLHLQENSCAENSTEKTSKMDIDTMSERIYNAAVDRMSE